MPSHRQMKREATMASDKRWTPADMTYDPERYEIDLWFLGRRVECALQKSVEATHILTENVREGIGVNYDLVTAVTDVMMELSQLHGWLACLGIVAQWDHTTGIVDCEGRLHDLPTLEEADRELRAEGLDPQKLGREMRLELERRTKGGDDGTD